MKSIFTKLGTLLFCGAVAMVGCSDFSADLREVNEKLENFAANTAKEIQNLSDAVKALEAKIAEQFATKEEVAAVEATVTALKADLKKAQEDLQAALDTKADKATVEAAIAQANEALAAIQTALAELTAKDEALAAADAALQAAIEALQKEVADAQAALQATIESIQNTIGSIEDALQFAINEIAALNDRLTSLQSDLLAYKAEVEAQFASVAQALVALEQTLTAKIDALASDAADKDEVAVAQLEELKKALATVNDALLGINEALAGKADQSYVDALEATLQAALQALENKVDSWKDNDTIYNDAELRAAIADATAEYKAITADLQAQIDALVELMNDLKDEIDGIKDSINDAKNELRAAILVPDMLYNGTKAVKFARLEGKNVLKTFATVSYRFNPSNFDASKATYEIVAEQVEVMTKGIFTEEPAIEIIGAPVQEDDKVTFELERAEGVGNMFALKVTLEDGTTIYSDYAAIVDEATFATATATASFPVERLVFELPKLNSISAIVEFVQSLGETVEDFGTTIEAINGAVQAIQNNDIVGALENLVKIPGFRKETINITGTGVYKVQVETLDAMEIIEALQNAQSIDEIRNIITDLLAQAEGLGEAGSTILDGLNGALGNSGLNELLGQYDNLKDFQLPELVLTYEKAVATLNGYQAELDKAKAEFQTLKDEMDAIIAALDAATQAEIAALQAELDALNAQYETASTLEKIALLVQIEAKELEITSKAGTDYFLVKAELDLKDAGVKTAELLLKGAREAVDLADKAVKNGKETLAKLEAEIISKVKGYIMENTELGKYLTELENALGEQAWEAKKTVAAGTAQLFAIDAMIADLIQNYNAANQQVVDEFANSLFGRVAYLIQTQEAADAFEAIGLTELYTVVKQLPDLITLIIKYYPAGVDLTNFNNFNDFGTIFSDYITNLIPETTVEWELDYFMAE